jgi:hypothetical protein
MPSLIGIPGSPRDARCGAVLDNEGPRGGGQGNGGNFAGMAGGYGAGTSGDFGSGMADNYGFGTNNPEMGGGAWRSAGLGAVAAEQGMFGGTNAGARAWQSGIGQEPDTSAVGALAKDFVGINNPGGFARSDAATLGRLIGTIGLGMVNPLAGMAFNSMTGLAQGRNPGGLFGSQAGGFGGGQLGSLLGGALGPAGSAVGGILGSQLGSYAGGRLGASAYNNGYSAPAAQGPAAQGALGQTQAPQPAAAPAAPAEFAGLSQPAVTAPVSNPVANPLRALLLALGPRAGINVPLLLGGQPQPQQRQGNSVT